MLMVSHNDSPYPAYLAHADKGIGRVFSPSERNEAKHGLIGVGQEDRAIWRFHRSLPKSALAQIFCQFDKNIWRVLMMLVLNLQMLSRSLALAMRI